jgi:hypothetical protein
MGEVYRARDAKLDRDVAIKVLPDAVSRDPERLARFEREAKTLAREGPRLQPRRTSDGRGRQRSWAVADDDGDDQGGLDHRHRGLHDARAGRRQARRQARGHLGVRRRAVGDVDGPASPRRRNGFARARRRPHAGAGSHRRARARPADVDGRSGQRAANFLERQPTVLFDVPVQAGYTNDAHCWRVGADDCQTVDVAGDGTML